MKATLFFLCFLLSRQLLAQADSGSIRLEKDPRVDLLIKKQIQINDETTRDSRRNIPGFRIQVINSTDRNQVFAVKARIYQEYPELKPYLIYQAPFYRLRVGNFKTEDAADPYLQQLAKMFPSGLYIVRDIIEVKPD